MKFAYADPPYPGMSRFYRDDPQCAEVDHAGLVARLCRDYPDGWALSTASTTLQQVLAVCPAGVRIASWVKPFCSFKPGVGVAYAWEPVIFAGGRRRTREQGTVRDWVASNITLKKGLTGAKPKEFCYWIFDMLNVTPEDEVHDLFPGTGVVTRCLADYTASRPLQNEPLFQAVSI